MTSGVEWGRRERGGLPVQVAMLRIYFFYTRTYVPGWNGLTGTLQVNTDKHLI